MRHRLVSLRRARSARPNVKYCVVVRKFDSWMHSPCRLPIGPTTSCRSRLMFPLSNTLATQGHEITTFRDTKFQDYLTQFPDELPRLGQDFRNLGQEDPNLNCHCHAIRLKSGQDGPAEFMRKHMNSDEAAMEVRNWFHRQGYSEIDMTATSNPLARDVRNEKVIVFGLTQAEARHILGSGKRISDDLKSTLATALQFNEGVLYPTHSIVQNIAGHWESKMGSGPVIEISTPSLLGGGVYGEPRLGFSRKRF